MAFIARFRCKICESPECEEVDRLGVADVSPAEIADIFDHRYTAATIRKHLKEHAPPGPVERLDVELLEQPDTVLASLLTSKDVLDFVKNKAVTNVLWCEQRAVTLGSLKAASVMLDGLKMLLAVSDRLAHIEARDAGRDDVLEVRVVDLTTGNPDNMPETYFDPESEHYKGPEKYRLRARSEPLEPTPYADPTSPLYSPLEALDD